MLTDTTGNWTVRGMTFVLWAAAAASAAYWGLKLGGGGPAGAPVAPPARAAVQADPAAMARLLGQTPGGPAAADTPTPPSAAARMQLLGVVADGARQGAALIAVDGRPAKPFRVGASVEDGLVLQSVRGRQAQLGAAVQGPASVTLELPPPAAPPTSAGAGAAVGNAGLPPPGGMTPPGPPPAR